jgi:signal transduction histidine kinase
LISCNRKKTEQNKVNLYYEKAYDYLEAGRVDSSFLLFEKAKQLFLENADSLGVAKSLINMAITQRLQGDLYGGQETSLEALKYLNEKELTNRVFLSTNYNNLASATHSLQNYAQAIEFYDLAIKFSDDSLNSNIYLNNLALSYVQLKDYESAIKLFKEVLYKVRNQPMHYARVLSNLAFTKWKDNSHYVPVPDLLKALEIREEQNDFWGQNASFAHLADYYEKTNADSSLFYARKQYVIAKQIKSADDQIKALERLIKVIPLDSVTFYFNRYRVITDSIQQVRAAAKNQFALIRYEVEKNKSDNLRLQNENAEKQIRLTTQRVITGSTIILSLIAIGGGIFWYKKRKQRLELEAQNKIKENKLHLSKKIHDVVANGIYRVMTDIEHKKFVDRDGVLDKLDDMYKKSRDISHEVEEQTETEVSYGDQLTDLLKSFASDQRRVLIAGNDSQQWDDINKRTKAEIKHVLQELMVNMKKHSQADQVVIRFESHHNQMEIFYKDNGIGASDIKSTGKGHSNMVSRIEGIGGKIIFVSEEGKGWSVKINIPIL